jgi:acetyl-CoA carboxylase carboxyl transferase subunit beta
VIEQTIHHKLPADFQTAEFLLEKGQVDLIVPRTELRAMLAKVLTYHTPGPATTDTSSVTYGNSSVRRPDPAHTAPPASAWEVVGIARHQQRPRMLDFVKLLFQRLHRASRRPDRSR